MAKCTVSFDNKTYQLDSFASQLDSAKRKVNTNINPRHNVPTFNILKEDNLLEMGDDGRPQKLTPVSKKGLTGRIIADYEERGGAFGVLSKAVSSLQTMSDVGKTLIGEKTIDDLRKRITKPIEVYDSMIAKLTSPSDLEAAGITPDEYEAYIAGESLDDDVMDRIYEYQQSTLSSQERSLFNALRKIYSQVFPLMERAGDMETGEKRLLFENGTYTGVNAVADQAEASGRAVVKRMEELFGKNAVTKGLGAMIRQANRLVSVDNILMKMGFQKGSAIFDILFQAINRGKTLAERENALSNNILKGLVSKYGKFTNWLTNTNWKNIEKTAIDFGNTTVELTADELISVYMTLRQNSVRERFMYTEEDAQKNKEPKPIVFREFKSGDMASDNLTKQRDKQEVILTEQAWQQIQEAVSGEQYQEIIKEFDKIFDEQHTKVDSTLYVLNGQRLPNINGYFPTFADQSNLTTYQLQQKMIDDLRYTKERRNGIDRLQIRGAFTTVHNYIEASNYYHHTAIPVHNAQTLWGEIKKRRVFEKGWELAVKNYETWLEGVSSNEGYLNYTDSEKIVNKVAKLFYIGTLGWNIPVVMKQPLAALHAANFFQDAKYGKAFTQAFAAAFDPKSKLIKEAVERSPAFAPYFYSLKSPELGISINTGLDLSSGAVINSGALGKVEEMARKGGDLYINNALSLIKRFDIAGRAALFASAKEWVTDNYGLTEQDGDKYWEEVASIHQQAMEDTQQTWDFMHRSAVARNPNVLMRGILMFSSQLQKHFSLLDKSFTEAMLYGRKEDFKALSWNIVSVMIVQASMVAAIDMGRDFLLGYDDDEEDKFKTLAAKTLSNNLATIPFAGVVANDIVNAVFGTDEYSSPVSVPLLDLMNEGRYTIKLTGDKNWERLYDQVWKDYSKYAGIPLTPFKQIQAALDNVD